MSKKPLIGVISLYDTQKDSYWMLPNYIDGIENAGGVPIILPYTTKSEIARLADICDGFLLTGGQDICPNLYKEPEKPTCGETCAARDNFELELLKSAIESNKPVLGICRGIQLLNVALGGTLYQDLPTEHSSATTHSMTPPYDRTVHYVDILEGTPLFDLIGQKRIGVNSYHHQALKTLAPSLTPMAISEDGLVESVYYPAQKFTWAIQWHPELSYKTDNFSQKIFEIFIKSARGNDK